jgi:hypothetical protein
MITARGSFGVDHRNTDWVMGDKSMAPRHIAQIQETNMFLKSMRLIPLMVLLLIAYNVVIMLFVGEGQDPYKEVFNQPILNEFQMISGGKWTFTVEHLFLLVGLTFLFFELIKATSIGGTAIAEMAISTIVFIIFLVEFLLVENASSSLFFLLMVISLIDVIAGYVIGIKVARRDLAIGGGLM